MKIIRYLIPLLVILAGITASGQDKDRTARKEIRKARDKHLGFGIGTAYVRSLDKATSPLVYQGMQLVAAKLDYQVHSDKIIKAFETEFSYGNLHTRTETPWYDPRNTSYLINFRYTQLWSITRLAGDRINLYVGPELNINNHFRVNYKYGNSAFTFDNYGGLGGAVRFELPFSWKARQVKLWFMKFNRRDRDLRLSWQLSAPVVSYLVRPTYVTITNFIDPDLQTQISPDQTTGGFFVPLNIRSQTELCYQLQNRNMLKLSYIWNFYHHDPGYNKSQSAFHAFLFSFVYKFNPNTK